MAENKLMITFFANTIIRAITNNAPIISRHKFEFFPFEKLEERAGADFVLIGKTFQFFSFSKMPIMVSIIFKLVVFYN